MKTNFNHITMIITLTFACNIQSKPTSNLDHEREQIRKLQDEERTKQTASEIEDLLINSEIPLPHFEDPAIWKVLSRQYGIPLLCTFISIKTWLVQKYYNLKDVIYENSKDETI